LFETIPPSITTAVTYPNSSEASIVIKAIVPIGKFTSIFGSFNGTSIQLLDDGAHNDGVLNDGIFANTLTIARSLVSSGLNIVFTDINNKTFIIQNAVERITTTGPITLTNAPIVFDNINNNGVVNNGEFVQFGFTIKNNSPFTLTGLKALVSTNTEFANEYTFGTVSAGSESSVANDKSFSFRLPINYSDPTYNVNISLSDDKGNLWFTKWEFPVVQYSSIADSLTNASVNVVGNNDGAVGFILYDKSLAGQQYDVWYGLNGSKIDWTVVKNLSSADYAAVSASLSAAKEVPAINTLPNAAGSGTFTMNDAKDQVTYAITVSGLTGSITDARIYLGSYSTNGVPVKTLSFIGNSAVESVKERCV